MIPTPGKTILREKLNESIASVIPIALIVALLCLSFVPVTTDLMLAFLLGTIMLVVGMGLFTLGVEASMTQIGNHTGARMTKSRKLWLILTLSFILGIAITVAEPDLQVLASNVPHINTTVLDVYKRQIMSMSSSNMQMQPSVRSSRAALSCSSSRLSRVSSALRSSCSAR